MFNNPLAILHPAVSQEDPPFIQGVIVNNPVSFEDPLLVEIPQWQPGYHRVIADWPACHGRTLPTAGAACLLAIDDLRETWCVRWKGTTTWATGPVRA